MKPIDCSKIKKILISRVDRIGDVILSTPVFSAIKKQYPNAHISVLVVKDTAPTLRKNPFVDDVIILDKKEKHKTWVKTFLFGLSLRKYKFDVAIHLHPTNRVNAISWAANIPIRIGYQVQLGNHGRNDFFLTHKIQEQKWKGKKHEAEYNFDLLKFINISQPEHLDLYFPLAESDLDDVRLLLPQALDGQYVVFHPSASCISKRWPIDRMAEVADYMASSYGVLPVIIGEGEGVVHADEMQSHMRSNAVNLSGKLSLGMLGWVLKNARLLISNDSGPVHIASAVGIPVVSIFGRNQPGLSPIRWRPLSEKSAYIHKDVGCIVCLAHKCEINFKCQTELLIQDVLDIVKQYEPVLVTQNS